MPDARPDSVTSDVALDENAGEVRVRREMERMFGKPA